MIGFNYSLVIKSALEEETTRIIEINSADEFSQFISDELFKYFFHPIEWDIVAIFKEKKYDELIYKFPYTDKEGKTYLKQVFDGLNANDFQSVIKNLNSYLSITRYNFISYELINRN